MEVIKSPGPPPVTTTEVTRGGSAAYTVTINALPGALNEKLNNFKFYGATAVTASGAATFVSATGASCVPDVAGTKITCSVPGEFAITALPASVSFTVVFKAPTNVDATKITFSGYSTYDDSSKNRRRTWVYNETEKTNTATADTPLIAPSTTSVSTYVPTSTTSDTALYTGTLTAGGVVGTIPIVSAFVNDPLTTTVVVPANSTATTVYVLEDESGLVSSCNVNPKCFQSTITAPGTFSYLTIILRRDQTTILSCDKAKGKGHCDDRHEGKHGGGQSSIETSIVYYAFDNVNFVPVPDCSTNPALPLSHQPCVFKRTAYPSDYPIVDLRGDWEYVIRAVDNGRYNN